MADNLAVLTPWYPAPNRPFMGAFVRATVDATEPLFGRTDVYHGEEWVISPPPPLGRGRRARVYTSVLARKYASLLADRRGIRPMREGHAYVSRVPVPVRPRGPWADLARAHERYQRLALRGGPLPAPVVHAHVGLTGGWPAVQLAEPGARVFVTEHSTFLDQVLAQDAAREMYDEVIDRCTTFFCVSDLLRTQLLDAFPRHADKIHIVPNPVPLAGIEPRPEPVTDLRRWLYVGSFSARKGVLVLLEAFALCRLERPDLELTMVGGGPLHDQLAARIAELSLGDAVRLVDAVPPEQVFDFFRTHDLLVHASRYETFGLTLIEALASGMPVLVTRCGGPEETLAGIERHAGELVPVSAGPVELVTGYHDLVSRFADLDLAAVRAELERRYGYEAVAQRLAGYYFGEAAAGVGAGVRSE